MSQPGVDRNQPQGAGTAAGHHWGNYASEADLPNVADDDLDVRPGDVACVGTELYVCRVRASGSASWMSAGASGGPTRVFAPPGIASAAADTLAVQGDDVASVVGTLYIIEMPLPYRKSVTGIGVLNGTIVGTDNIKANIYDADGTFIVGSPATLGSGPDAFQELPLTAATVLQPGLYWVGVECNGTTHDMQRYAEAGVEALTKAETGHTFGDNSDITAVPTAFVDAAGPIVYLYS